MNKSPIEIAIGQMNTMIEDEIVKACANVGVNVNKEELLNALKSLNFVRELVEYIFTYPDDDYMTMECLCRKLRKHNLIWYADGQYMPLKLEVAEQTEPSECEKCCIIKGSTECKRGQLGFCKGREQTEPQTCQECEHWNDTEDGCDDRHGCKDEPQTEDLQDWKDRMWAEAVIASQTENE